MIEDVNKKKFDEINKITESFSTKDGRSRIIFSIKNEMQKAIDKENEEILGRFRQKQNAKININNVVLEMSCKFESFLLDNRINKIKFIVIWIIVLNKFNF